MRRIYVVQHTITGRFEFVLASSSPEAEYLSGGIKKGWKAVTSYTVKSFTQNEREINEFWKGAK